MVPGQQTGQRTLAFATGMAQDSMDQIIGQQWGCAQDFRALHERLVRSVLAPGWDLSSYMAAHSPSAGASW